MGGRTALVLRRAEKLKAEDWERFGPRPCGASTRTCGPFSALEGEWDRGKVSIPKVLTKHKFWAVAEKKGWVWQSRGLFGEGMAALRAHLDPGTGHKKSSPRRRKPCVRPCPRTPGAAALELSKMELSLGPDKTIGMAQVDLIAPSGEMDFFEFVGLLSKQGATAEVWERVIQKPCREQDHALPAHQLPGWRGPAPGG